MKRLPPLMEHLEIDQVCIVVRDIEKAIGQMSSWFNIGPFRSLEMDVPDAILHGKQSRLKFKAAFAPLGKVELELIEPGEGESTYSEFLGAKGEGVHHLRAIVSDIESELVKFKERGIEPLQSGENQRVKFAYIDTENIAGVIIELLEWKQSRA